MSYQSNYFSVEDSTSSLIKNIYKDDDTGKIILTDFNNNQYESDIFGRKLTTFLPKITGIMRGNERKMAKLNKLNKYFSSPSKNNSNSYTDIIQTKKNINYHPKVNRLDGYSFFPRPISLPFYNIPDFEINNNLKKELNKEAKRYFNKCNKIKSGKKDKVILSYLTKDLNEFNLGEKDKEKLLNLVDNNIDELKEEYKIKINAIGKNPNYIALNKFKKKLLNIKNNDSKFKEIPDEIKMQYKINNNILESNLLKRKNNAINKSERKYINKYFKKMGKSITSVDIEKKNNFKKFNKNYKKKNLVIGPDKLNDLCRSKDFGIGRSIKMDFGNHSYEEKEKIFPLENNMNTERIPEENKIKNDSIDILPKISNKNINYLDKDTAETVTNMNRNNTEARFIDEKIEDDEISFISRENEINEVKRKKPNIKTLKFTNRYCTYEKELLEGIKIDTKREEAYIPLPKKNHSLKNNGQLYRENIALLKLTNPKKFKLLEQKDEYDMKLLIKKLGRTKKKTEINSNKI